MTDTPWRLIVDKNSYADFSVSVSPAVEKAVVNGDAPPTIFLNIFDRIRSPLASTKTRNRCSISISAAPTTSISGAG